MTDDDITMIGSCSTNKNAKTDTSTTSTNEGHSFVDSLLSQDLTADNGSKKKTSLVVRPSLEEWTAALQDEEVVTGPTIREQWPLLWRVVSKYYKYFCDIGYEVCINYVNKTDFKKLMLKRIVESRVMIEVDVFPHRSFLPDWAAKKQDAYYYNQQTFEQYANAAYSKDIKVKLEANVNDIICTFGILALSKHRDSLTRIAIAKDVNRMETDSPEGALTTIFKSVGDDFKNFNVDLLEPDRAIFLNSYKDMDPNDMTRMLIERKPEFFKGIYFNTLKKYNRALVNFQKGTGGGSGKTY